MINMRRFTSSLNFRITLPVVLLVFFMWLGLNMSVFRAVDEFQTSRIAEDMEWASRFTYNIINKDFYDLTLSEGRGKERHLRIVQGRSIGALEEFARQKGFVAAVYSHEKERLLLDGSLPLKFIQAIQRKHQENHLGLVSNDGREYYLYHFEFEPWGWRIFLLKEVASYAAFVSKERSIQVGTGVVVLLAAFLLYFSLRWNIHRPIRQIIDSLAWQTPPRYTGVGEFEYLSARIRSMVSSLEEREQFLASVFDSIQDGISILDADLNVVRVNRTMEKWYSHIPSLVGKKCYEVYHGREAVCDNCPSIRTMETGSMAVELVPRIGADGEITGWLELHTFPLLDRQTGVQEGVIEYVRDVTKQRATAGALEETRERFQVAFHAGPDPMVIVRLSDRTVVDVNTGFVESTGYAADQVVGKRSEETPYWKDDESRDRLYDAIRDHGLADNMEMEFRLVSGELRPGLLSARIMALAGEPHLLVLVKDISQLKNAEARLKNSLSEKEVLLKEIHHRVKNNLQVISGLLNLQAHHISDPVGRSIYKESQNRVITMALIHEDLYRSADLSSVNLEGYIKNLAENLFRSYQVGHGRVKLELDVEHTEMVVDTAIPCGLIMNELISNALKHAFPGDRAGTLTVRFRSTSERQYYLEVSDDGVGLPPGMDFADTTTLGMQLVKVIVEQLAGTMEIDGDHGTTFRISFAEYLEAGTVLY
ncbi:MAG: histidine kinase dimerization/phosphoacceptor domain -containing protein [bacterium]|nr:histidine kinase dimerization/phosphoacceptor domain -containing protein [bacterium]